MTVAAVSGSGIAVAVGGGGSGVAVGGVGVGVGKAVGRTGVAVDTACAPTHPASNKVTGAKPNIDSNSFLPHIILPLLLFTEVKRLRVSSPSAYQYYELLAPPGTMELVARTPAPEGVRR
jgi:hypothetical protein